MEHVDLLALAPYFGSSSDCSIPAATTDDLCAEMAADAASRFSPTTGDFRAAHDLYSSPPYSKSWSMITYEAGQHQFGMDYQVCVDIVTEPDSCIAQTYSDALDLYRAQAPALPIETFMQFNNVGRFWVTTTDMGQTFFGNNPWVIVADTNDAPLGYTVYFQYYQ